jgi:FMN phosphatase YigB (HAD superfamily)
MKENFRALNGLRSLAEISAMLLHYSASVSAYHVLPDCAPDSEPSALPLRLFAPVIATSERANKMIKTSSAAVPLSSKNPTRFSCFDVFDTLLTHAVGNPDHVFLLLGHRLSLSGQIRCSAEVFARQRMHAEERAHSMEGCHPTLEKIYGELVRSLGAAPGDLPRLLQAELALERTLSRKIPSADALVRDARRSGDQVVFVTDTNMSSEFIRELLTSKGLCQPQDLIFTSCECRVDKARGLLYSHVSRALGASTKAFRHNGNDAVADVRNGRLSGWKVRRLPGANLNRYERALASEAYATGGLSSVLAGAARLARLAAPIEDGRTIRSVAAGVVAPCLVAWVIWVMRQAVRDGCRRLYFLSRDGQVLLEIARRLELTLRTELDIRYLFTSRRVLQRCGSADVAFRDLLRLQSCRMKDVAAFLAIDPVVLASMLPTRLRNILQWDLNLSAKDREEVAKLLGHSEFRSRFDDKSAEVRTLFVEYLSQEGWGDGTPFGLVDVGWRASTAGMLNSVLAGSSLKEPHRYYFFGLSNDAYRIAGSENVEKLSAWLFDESGGYGYLPYLPSTSSLVEMFCAGEHGAVIAFRREGDRVEPILQTEISPMQEWGLAAIRQTITTFTDGLVGTLQWNKDLVDIDADLRRPVDRVMRLFWLHPTVGEVQDWGSFPVEVNLSNSLVMPLAERVGIQQLWTALRSRTFSFRSEHGWPRGTAVKSSWPFRMMLTAVWWLRRETPRLRRRLQWLRGRLGVRTL